MKKKYSLIELFCGCGGFSYGFEMSGRFETILGVDIKPEALATFRANHSIEPAVIQDDIREISDDTLLSMLAKHGIGVGDLDCLIGGPPCQGFSQMRRLSYRDNSEVAQFKGYSKLAEDPRNDLILRFLEIAVLLKPKFIVIENVKQVKNHVLNGKEGGFIKAIEEVLGESGYDVTHSILNAAQYGIPQLRERAFVLASRETKAEFPEPTHSSEPDLFCNLKPFVSVADAIGDLPEPTFNSDDLGGSKPDAYIAAPSNEYQQIMRKGIQTFPFNHITRSYSEKIINIIKDMPQGQTWNDVSSAKINEYEQLISEHMKCNGISREDAQTELENNGKINPVFYKKYYWSAYTRLHPEKPSLTVTANANFLGSGRYTHPYSNRGITAREAARLQSFPDTFKFITDDKERNSTDRIGVAMDMIGEAVPPLLASKIAGKIASELDSINFDAELKSGTA